jgi:hypothetical protein
LGAGRGRAAGAGVKVSAAASPGCGPAAQPGERTTKFGVRAQRRVGGKVGSFVCPPRGGCRPRLGQEGLISGC